MILPDVNVLIYAFRRDLPEHTVCCWWLAGVVMSDARFGLSPLVLGAVVRVTTNPRVYRTPSTIEEERHWDIFKRLCIETETQDPLLPMPAARAQSRRPRNASRLDCAIGSNSCGVHVKASYANEISGCCSRTNTCSPKRDSRQRSNKLEFNSSKMTRRAVSGLGWQRRGESDDRSLERGRPSAEIVALH